MKTKIHYIYSGIVLTAIQNENKIALFPLSYSVTNHSYFGFHSDVILIADHW